ncbi:MAG: DDE-type integrase/transposase/recombinase [Acidobacteriaceae bacterium]|nr:DDE-type integrase/transposase/recombinase [Acidobacteriaceae bacterium]
MTENVKTTTGLEPFRVLDTPRPEVRKARGYDVESVGGLWHIDSFQPSRRVLTRDGWRRPVLFSVLDDHSELACHAQWYLVELTQTAVDSLMQAMQKYGLPRSILSDNSSPMSAREIRDGLSELNIVHETTLPYCPWQADRQEHFWRRIDYSVLPMLEGVRDLSLDQLNEATRFWIESEYNCKPHPRTGVSPTGRFHTAPITPRACPDPMVLKQAFMRAEVRRVRKSDGTVVFGDVRFHVPEIYRDLPTIEVRYAPWDLNFAYMVDRQTGAILCHLFPLASRHR